MADINECFNGSYGLKDLPPRIRSLLTALLGSRITTPLDAGWSADAANSSLTLRPRADAPLDILLRALLRRPCLEYLDLGGYRGITSDSTLKRLTQALQSTNTHLRALSLAGCGRVSASGDRGLGRLGRSYLRTLGLSAWAFPLRHAEQGCVLLSLPGNKGHIDDAALPHLRRSVVFVLSHGDQGTVGLILNKLSPFCIEQVASAASWSQCFGNSRLYLGGEHGQDLSVLHGHKDLGGYEVIDNLFLGSDEETFANANRAVMKGKYSASSFQWFMGLHCWPPGLLAQEIRAGRWHPAHCDRTYLLPELGPPEKLWADLWVLVN